MTFRKTGFVALALLLATAAGASAQQLLDVVPQDVTAAVAVRNLNELIRKGDKFLEETQLPLPARPSQLFDIVLQSLGITGGLDRERPAAILLLLPEKQNLSDFDFMVAALPFTDLDDMASNFGFPKGQLKPGRIVKLDGLPGRMFGKFVFVRDKHLFLGGNEKTLEGIVKSKSLAAELSRDRREALNRADVLVHLNPRLTRGEWPKILQAIQEELVKASTDAQEKKNLREFIAGLESIRHLSIALRVGGGLGFSFLADFPKDGAGKNAFLSALASGAGSSELRGLPEGNLLVAQGIRGDGAKGAVVARAFLDLFLKYFIETRKILSAADRPMFVGVFQEIWQRLQGSRWGLYQSSDESRFGLFSLVAILDTDDADQFVAELKTFARLAQGTLDLKAGKKTDTELIQKLLGDLGDRTYRVRQSATTKLRLIGEPGLPHLEKLIGTGDLEVSRRAQNIRDQIAAVAAERRKELLAKGLPKIVRPSLTFFPKAEQRDGLKVDVVQVELSQADPSLAKRLAELLGPDWDKIRLAVQGKQVVALLGSDTELFDQTLKNLKEDLPGLAAAKPLAGFHRLAHPDRKIEFHIALHKTLALVTAPDKLPRGEKALTSFSLAVEAHQLQLDLWLPSDEIRLLARNANLFR